MFETTTIEKISDSRVPAGLGGCWYGVYPAVVTSLDDEDGQGRVRIALSWSPDGGDTKFEAWARVATMMGGDNRGSWFIPDLNDEVLVAFEGGNPRRPYVVGCLWNGKDKPPEKMDKAGKNDKKVLRSRNGVKITLDDKKGKEQMILETPGGQKITLKDGPGAIEIVDSNGNSIKLASSGITIEASAKVSVSASVVEVSSGTVKIDAGTTKVSGLIMADAIQCNTIMSSSYMPGAGNIW